MNNESIHLVLGGDVMLGRLVKQEILKKGSDYPLGKIEHLMRQADLTIINLECAITNNPHRWSGAAKAFYFGAPPQAIQALVSAGVDLVSLANNHMLDYDYQGLTDTIEYLQKNHIHYVGAGEDIQAANTPSTLECKQLKFGMVAFCDHQEDFAATKNRSGIAYIDLDDEAKTLDQWQNKLIAMQKAEVNWPILSLHWGPNMVHRPSAYFVHLAHQAIEMGYKIIFGHSAHVFHGIELYRGYPIFYATGDLVDDYYVDPEFRNDHQLLFKLEIKDKVVTKIILYPVFIEHCQVRPAVGKEFDFISQRAQLLCREMNTSIQQIDYEYLLIKNKSTT